MKLWNKNTKKICIWFVIILIVELFWSNAASLGLGSKSNATLLSEIVTDESGSYESEPLIVDTFVKNVYIKAENNFLDYTTVTLALTDEGDRYEYELPAMTVIDGKEDTYYQKIYPFGKVHTIRIIVKAPEGTQSYISKIEINKKKPFSFHIGRFFLLFVLSLIWLLGDENSCLASYVCEKGNKRQWLGVLLCVSVLAVLSWKIVHLNPYFVKPAWPHHKQYQELAECIDKGTVILPYEPSEGVIEAENPYDTLAFLAEGTPFLMDYAYYQGHYYVYFGLVPEILLFYPFYKLMGHHLENYQAIYLLYLLFALGVFGSVRQLIFRFGKRLSYWHSLLISFVACMLPNYLSILVRPDLYHIPIMAGSAFLMLSLWLFLLGKQENKGMKKVVFLFLGALCGALVAGCRPQFLLYEIFVAVLFLPEWWSCRKRLLPEKGKDILAIVIPYLVVGAVVFWYNAARFGSGFDFGATYSLTTNDMNHRGFYWARVVEGFYSFWLQPPNLKACFPYVFRVDLRTNFMGKNLTEFTFGGALLTTAFFAPIFTIGYGLKKNRYSIEQKIWILLFCLVSLVITIFDANSAGILQRYMADMVLGLMIAAILLWIVLLDQENVQNHDVLGLHIGIFKLCVVGTLLFGFFMLFAEGDSNCLQNSNPALYYELMKIFG